MLKNTKKIRTAIYVRVSSEEQKNNGYGIESQLSDLKKHISLIENDGFYYDDNSIYKDEGFSGGLDENNRPRLLQLLSDIDNGKIGAVLVWKIDRIARSTLILLNLVNNFNKNGIIFLSSKEKIDTYTANGKFFLTILGAFAEMERNLISERTSSGKRTASRGNIFVYGNPPFGYIKNPQTKKLEVDEEKGNFIKKVFDLYVNEEKTTKQMTIILEGLGYGKLFAKKINNKNIGKIDYRLINKILIDRTYINDYYVNKYRTIKDLVTKITTKTLKPEEEWIKFNVEPLIDIETFEKAQNMISKNKTSKNNLGKKFISHLFSGIMQCGECGRKYNTYRKLKKGKYYNYCLCGRKSYDLYGSVTKCDNGQVSEDIIKDAVFKKLNTIIKNPTTYLNKLINENNNLNLINNIKLEVKKLKSKREEYENDLGKTITCIISERNQTSLNIFSKKKNELEENIIKIDEYIKEKEKQILELENDEVNRIEIIDFYKKINKIKIDDMSYEEQKTIIHLFIYSIIIYKDDISIKLKYTSSGNSKDDEENINDGEISLDSEKQTITNLFNAFTNSTIVFGVLFGAFA